MRKLVRLLTGIAMIAYLAVTGGCGNNLGTPSGELTRAVAFNIQWPVSTKGVATSRDAVLSPLGAVVAKIVLPAADAGNNDVIITAIRDPSQGTGANQTFFTQTYYPPVSIKTGTRSVKAIFYQDPQQQTALSEINTSLSVNKNGGSINFTTAQQPDKIVITPSQTLRVQHYQGEQPYKLNFVASVGAGAGQQILAVNPSYVHLAVTDGTSVVGIVPNPNENLTPNPNDSLQGLQSGTAMVTVTVGTTVSAAEQVTVTSPTHVTINPQQIGQNGEVTGGLSYAFTATVVPPTDAIPQNIVLQNGSTHDSNLDVTWSLREGAGALTVRDPNSPNAVVYTTPTKSGIYHVLATSVYDKGLVAVAEVKVTQGNVTISFQP